MSELTTEQIEKIKARKLIAQNHITDLCKGARWRMSIPVRDTDSDVVMQATLNDMSALLNAYEWLRNEFVSAREELEAEQHDNERLRARVAELEAPREGILAAAQALRLKVNEAAGQEAD